MSSYQLELTFSLTFDVAVLLNITPDHLDRHGGMDGYIAAKKLVFHRQTAPRAAIIGIDAAISAAIHPDLAAAGEQIVVPISAERVVSGGLFAAAGGLFGGGAGGRAPAARPSG